jgi:hypothetical protein
MTWILELLNWDTAMGLGKTLAVILAVGVAAFALQTVGKMLRPIGLVVGWLFAIRADRPPSDIVTGISIGLRIAAWAGIVVAVLVFCFGRSSIGLGAKGPEVVVIDQGEDIP